MANDSQGVVSGPLRIPSSRSRRWALAAVVAAVAAAGAALPFWWRPSPQPPLTAAANRDADIEEDDPGAAPVAPANPGYVGPQACAACHARRVAEFEKTRHFHACRLPKVGAMPPGFAPGRGTYPARDPALRFEMTRQDDDFIQTAVHATPDGERRTAAHIDLVYGGGGKADEIYFTWHGDRLNELPVVWLHPQSRWGEQPFDPYGAGDFSRGTTPRCLECHNTWFAHVPGTPNRYDRHNAVLGVTCERCHGPGREHVAYHRAHPDADSARFVVHPGRLTRDRQMDLCGQCHSNAVKRRGPAFSYRPGQPLGAAFRVSEPRHQEEDHVADQVKYLRQSKCFQKSDALTCVTCHNPHRPTDPDTVRRSCLKCHGEGGVHCAEGDRLPAAVRGDCVGCHMPRFTRIQVFFHTEDDQYVPAVRPHRHRIAVYPEARQEVLLGWYAARPDAEGRREAGRLRGALGRHWLAEADEYRRQHRFLAAVGAAREALRLDPTAAARERLREVVATRARLDADLFKAQHQIERHRFPEAIETLTEVLRVKPDWAKAHGRLGTAYAAAGQGGPAAEHLRAVARYDPDDAYGYAMLGWLAYLEGRAEEAAENYRRADEIEPFNAKTNYHWGLALLKLGRWGEAAARFRLVLEIDPGHAGGCQGLGDALRREGRPAEAVTFARRAAGLTRYRNPDVLLTLAAAYADAGRFAAADRAATRALDAAAGDPDLAAQVRRFREELRARAR